ncbi:MAG: DNA N-6-adenine-methyltransferase [Acidobacteriota bacterium]
MKQSMQVLTSQLTDEWYTPPFYITLVEQVLTVIDLDPASSEKAQQWIQARRYFTKEDNGLIQTWWGKVFLNPPYGKSEGKSNQAIWANRLLKFYEKGLVEEAILLINSAHGYKWYESLWTRYPVCCVRERIHFVAVDGSIDGQSKKAQTFVYFGRNITRFQKVFSSIGRVLLPEQ